MSALIDFSLANRFVTFFNALLLLSIGTWAVTQLPIDAVPDVTNVQVQVLTTSPALGPEEVEQFITFPIETAMSGVPKVAEIRSVSQFGLSAITIVFDEGTDIYWARQMIGERLLDARENIPPGMGTPQMGPLTTGLGEIFQFEVRAKPGFNYSLMQLREILDWNIAYQLRGVPGVIEINTFGGELKTYEVELDANQLINYAIPINVVFSALQRNNANSGGGYIVHDQEQRVIRGEGLIKKLDDLADIVLETRDDGTPIRVRDVGRVRFAPMLRQGAVTRDGRGEGVVGIVMLLMGENARVVVNRVKEKITEIEKSLPPGVYIDAFYDRTELVKKTVETVARNLFEGGALVIIVLLILLGSLKAGLIVALAVPLSMLGAFIGMLWGGISGNLMSLGAIDFGLIVDGSVVMIENVVRRASEYRKEHGDPVRYERGDRRLFGRGRTSEHRKELSDPVPQSIIRDACHEVSRPVIFGVIIIVLVYLPILSLQGIEGKMFRPMALAVIFALVTSLFLALTLMPALASVFLTRGISEKETFLVHWVKSLYAPLLRKAIRHPVIILTTAGAIFVVSVLVASQMGAVFIPKLDEGDLAVQAMRLPSVSLEASIQMTTAIEKVLLEFPEVKCVVSKTGRPEIANDPMPVSQTDIMVCLHAEDPQKKHRPTEVLVALMEKALAERIPSNAFSFTQPIEMRVQELIAGVRSDIGISLYGDDLSLLKSKADEIAAALNDVPGAADVQVEQTAGLPSLKIDIDRAAIARYGINAQDILDSISAMGGAVVGQVFEGQRRFPLQVRFASQYRNNIERLRHIAIADPLGRQVPLDQLAKIEMVDGPAQISRDSIRRRILIQCNVRGRDLAGFVGEAQRTINQKVQLPTGYMIAWGGQFKNLQEATARLAIAVPLALFMIYAILHTTFNSLRLAFLIYLNVPMAATGGILALWLRGLPFSISAGVGFIALFGVAVLNGVVLVTYIVELRHKGEDIAAASTLR